MCRNKTVSLKEMVQVFGWRYRVGTCKLLIQGIAVRLIGSNTVYYTIGPISEEIIKIAFVFFLLFLPKWVRRSH